MGVVEGTVISPPSTMNDVHPINILTLLPTIVLRKKELGGIKVPYGPSVSSLLRKVSLCVREYSVTKKSFTFDSSDRRKGTKDP